MPRALRARQAFFAELFLAIFAEHVNFALILAPYFGVNINCIPSVCEKIYKKNYFQRVDSQARFARVDFGNN